MNHSLGKIDERDTNTKSYLEKIAQIIKDSTDKCFQIRQVKSQEPTKTWLTNCIKRHLANRDNHHQ